MPGNSLIQFTYLFSSLNKIWNDSPTSFSETDVEMTDLLLSSIGIAVPFAFNFIFNPRSESTIRLTIFKKRFSKVSNRTYYKDVGS